MSILQSTPHLLKRDIQHPFDQASTSSCQKHLDGYQCKKLEKLCSPHRHFPHLEAPRNITTRKGKFTEKLRILHGQNHPWITQQKECVGQHRIIRIRVSIINHITTECCDR